MYQYRSGDVFKYKSYLLFAENKPIIRLILHKVNEYETILKNNTSVIYIYIYFE